MPANFRDFAGRGVFDRSAFADSFQGLYRECDFYSLYVSRSGWLSLQDEANGVESRAERERYAPVK